MIDDPTVRCRDACGREHPNDEAATAAGWTQQSFAKAWRCGPCAAALRAASTIQGTDEPFVDAVPRDSRGALPRETASTITPPARGIG